MEDVLPTSYTVLAFYVMHGGGTKPIGMSIMQAVPKTLHITYDQSIFPTTATISQTTVKVEGRIYQVYFNITHHQINPETVLYLFVCLLQSNRPVTLCPEDDLPDVMNILDQ